MSQEHPNTEALGAFLLGEASPRDRLRIEAHLRHCDDCTARLAQIPDDRLVQNLQVFAAERVAPSLLRSVIELPPTPASQGRRPPEIPDALRNHPRYKVLKVLGVGGMGIVYRAEHRLMERTVALKVIHPQMLGNPAALERFQQEVRTAAKLSHPNIVTAFDADQAGSLHFLVMEHVEGLTLAKLVERKGPLSVRLAARAIHGAALGLEYAGSLQMVHRDIKPQNLMITRSGQTKIMDFGLARVAMPARIDGRSRLTTVGSLLGTPDFMAPEQANDSRSVDIRADLYSLGCTLYFALTGRVPFPEGTVVSKMLSHMESPPPRVSSVRADVPPEIDELVARLLAKNPVERIQTPGEVARWLDPYVLEPASRSRAGRSPEPAESLDLSEPRISTLDARPLASRKRSAGTAWVSIGLAGSILLGAGLLAWRANQEPAQPVVRGERSKPLERPSVVAPAAHSPSVAVLVASNNFDADEFQTLKTRLLASGARMRVVASTTSGQALSMPGSDGQVNRVKVDTDLGHFDPSRIDAIVLVGGMGVREYLGHTPAGDAVRELVQQLQREGKPVAAVGLGNGVLADAISLQGVQVAVPSWLRKKLVNQGANVVNESFASDQQILTAADAQAIPELVARLLPAAPARPR